jgi:UPF0755 protein
VSGGPDRPEQPRERVERYAFYDRDGRAEAPYAGAEDGARHDFGDHDEYRGHGQYEGHEGFDGHAGYEGYDDPEEAEWPVVGDPEATGRRSQRDPGGRGRRRRARRSHPVLTGLAIVVVVVLIVAGAGIAWGYKQINPGGRQGALVSVAIPPGSSTRQIGDRLAKAGVIHTSWLFAYYVHFHSDTLLPGTYELPKNSSYSAAISALEAGPKILTEKLVIPEGYTVAQIAKAVAGLPHLGLSAQKFVTAANNGTVRSPYEPAGVNNLEGLLFPDTYQVRQGESEVDILSEMEGTFVQRTESLGIAAAATRLRMTPYQLVEVASIIEKEAKLPGDRPDVASTIYNRLRIGMKLGADSTQTYWLRRTDPAVVPTAAQDDQPGPYNTRLNAGLPPTPIANPGLPSLQAALNPPSTGYLYWVEINPNGQLGFATDNAGFVSLQHQCRAAGLC